MSLPLWARFHDWCAARIAARTRAREQEGYDWVCKKLSRGHRTFDLQECLASLAGQKRFTLDFRTGAYRRLQEEFNRKKR